MEKRAASHPNTVELLALLARVRWFVADLIASVVDASGGWPIVLPDGTPTRVAFRCRHFARPYEAPVMRRFLSELKPWMTVVDVGAHWGLYSLVAAGHVQHVVAFEPGASNRDLLERNVALARLGNVEVREEAVTDRVGRVTFYAYEGHSWGLSMMGGLLRGDRMEPVEVPATTLDALQLKPDMLKIDVEGAEAAVIRGATNTILKARPSIFVEVHRERLQALGSSRESVRTLILDLGYEIEPIWEHEAAEGERIEHWLCRA